MTKTESTIFAEPGQLLKTLYPVEYSHLSTYADNVTFYDILVELLTMNSPRAVRPIPSAANVPGACLMQFSDFMKCDLDSRILHISANEFEQKQKSQLAFALNTSMVNTYKKVLFVESKEDYKNQAIPFVYTDTYKSPSGDVTHIYRSPTMFSDNTTYWRIFIKES